jgi:glycosyltransferase involved in cell wall biosynthesis
MRLAVATTFPIFPALGGGQSRVFHLYRELARAFPVDVVCLTHGERPSDRLVAPGLREVQVPISPAHRAADNAVRDRLGGVPVSDVLMPELLHLTPDYAAAFEAVSARASAAVVCHPWLLSAIPPSLPLWYEAQDVEVVLKRSVLPGTPLGRRLLDQVRRAERAACDAAALILACSADDAAALCAEHDAAPEKLVVVPNGADLSATFTPAAERAALRDRLGLGASAVAVFMGSWHPPNIEAVEHILRMAAERPEVAWLVLGSVGQCFAGRDVPRNVGLAGAVDEAAKALALACVDVAINPMSSGSGTNLKMLDYFAAGAPVISTPFGARGLSAQGGVHLTLASLADFAAAVAACRPPDAARVAAARGLVEQEYGWVGIADRLLAELRRRALILEPA